MIKVSKLPYERYTIETARKNADPVIEKIKNAVCAEELKEARDRFNEITDEFETAYSLANIRFMLNTKDEFYAAEMDYYDNVMPLFEKISNEYELAMLASPFAKEAEKYINPRVFKGFEISTKKFSDDIIEELQRENALVTEYSKFMGALVFDFDGEKMPLSVIRGKLEDSDRQVRKKACEAIGKTLGENAAKFDGFFDELVKIRTKTARKLGYENFIKLGYYRMGRIDYDEDMVSAFREGVLRDIVPVVCELKEKIRETLGLDRIMYYDDAVSVGGEMPHPVVNEREMFENAQKMYDSMDPAIGDFMRRMLEAEAFDVEARDGKWGGGCCVTFPKYKQPFILANFNSTAGDVDVITHEFGHSLHADIAFKESEPDLPVGMETCECHSMSMEFLCWPWMDKFFGEMCDKYRYKHIVDAFSFIPYGVIVDEFQHIVYKNPEMTPEQRKQVYKELEKKYRPYLSFENIPYLDEGTRWQFQMHIFESPFYYIDYCLAQCVAIGFLVMSKENYSAALEKYLSFLKDTGKISFVELVKNAGLPTPFAIDSLKEISKKSMEIIKAIQHNAL